MDEEVVVMRDPTETGGEGVPLRTFVGGRRTGLLNATWPLVRLELFSDRIRMVANYRLLRAAVPKWEASFDEITEVRAIGKIGLLNTGIRFRTKHSTDFAVFWTVHRPFVLDALEAVGLSVNREPARFHPLNPDTD